MKSKVAKTAVVDVDGVQKEYESKNARILSLGYDDEPTWSKTSNMYPFNCSSSFNPLQVLKRKNQEICRLSELSLDDGSYSNLAILQSDDDYVNAAAMFYSRSTGESWPFALFRDSSGTELCRWSDLDTSDSSSSIEKDCFDSVTDLDGQGWSYAGAIVNTTYYHELGFGPGLLKVVRNIHTDDPTFESKGTYKLVQGSKYIRAADMTHLTKYGCAGSDCIIGASDDSYLIASSDFLIGIANELEGLIIVSLDSDGTPLAYLYVLGLSIIIPDDDTGEPKLVHSVDYFRATGACYTIWSNSKSAPRVMCSSNGAKGLYELQLPLNLDGCQSYWNSFAEQSDNCWTNYLKTAKQCDRRCSYLRKPVVGYVTASAETNQNDGLTCLYTPAAEDIPDVTIDTSTQEELDDLIDCYVLETMTFENDDSYTKGAIVDSFTLSTGIVIPISANRLNRKGNEDTSSSNRAMIFDSSSPSGGDKDLVVASRNGDHILIISEDLDSNDPDDNAHGGVFYFDFSQAGPNGLTVISMLVVDTEETGKIELFDYDGNQIDSFIAIVSISDYESATIDINTAGVSSMKVTLYGSGAIDDIEICQTSSLEPTSTPTSSTPTLPLPTLTPTVPPSISQVPTAGGCSFQGACIQVSDLQVISESTPTIDCGGSCTYKLCTNIDTSLVDESSRMDQSRTCEKDENEGFSHACIPPEPSIDNWNVLNTGLCMADFTILDDFFLQSETTDDLSWTDSRYPSALGSTTDGKDETGNFGQGAAGGTELCVLGQGGTDVYFVIKDKADCDSTLYQGSVDFVDSSSVTTTLDFTCGNVDAYTDAYDPDISIIDSNSGQCNGLEGGGQDNECIWKITLPACPTGTPTAAPTFIPTRFPSEAPTIVPSSKPTTSPTAVPTFKPTRLPTPLPSLIPTNEPTLSPTAIPIPAPSNSPSSFPSVLPSARPSATPHSTPTVIPSSSPTRLPSFLPTRLPAPAPSPDPSSAPTAIPIPDPTAGPTSIPVPAPTSAPIPCPTASPTAVPTAIPIPAPTREPTTVPTGVPLPKPTHAPTSIPSAIPEPKPTHTPTSYPTTIPSFLPSALPSHVPWSEPSSVPTSIPSVNPLAEPTSTPTSKPTLIPSSLPIPCPTQSPSVVPSSVPVPEPTPGPSSIPTGMPSHAPTPDPSLMPTEIPTLVPTSLPTNIPIPQPTKYPTPYPTPPPSLIPTAIPTTRPHSDPTSLPVPRPTALPSSRPSLIPTVVPISAPSVQPTLIPTTFPVPKPTELPIPAPTSCPTETPTTLPHSIPTAVPIANPTNIPVSAPSAVPSIEPTVIPFPLPSKEPTSQPSVLPTTKPTDEPSSEPTRIPTTSTPSSIPSTKPTRMPTFYPSTGEPTTSYPTTIRPTSTEPTTSYPTTTLPTAGLPLGCFSELSLTITNYDPTYYYITHGAVWINGYIEHAAAGITILRGINLTISLSCTSSSGGAGLGIPSVWGREFAGKISNDVDTPSKWILYDLDLDISRIDFQITVIFDDAIVEVGDTCQVDFIVDYEDHSGLNSLTEDLNIIVIDDSVGSCEYPEGNFENVSLTILRPENPTTYRIYDWAVWIDCRISYSDVSNTILNDVNLKIKLNTNATDGAILDTPSVWGRQFDSITPNDAQNPTEWCLLGLDLDISQVDFQVKVKMTDDLLTIGDIFIVTFILEYEDNAIEEYLTINVRGDNDLPQGHFDNASLIITTTDPSSYNFYSRAVWIDGYIAHSDFGNSILSGLNLTISLSTPASAGATLSRPSVWGKEFDTVRANVVNETTIWYLEGLTLDITQVSFQLVVVMDDDLLSIGDSFVIDFILSYREETPLIEDHTIIVEERDDDSNDSGGDDDTTSSCSLAFGINSHSSNTYYLNSGDIWVAIYFQDSGDCTWNNISLVTSVDTSSSCVSIVRPCIWGDYCDRLISNDADDPTKWICSGLDMWLITRIDVLYRILVSDTCFQNGDTFTITFKYSQSGQYSSTDYIIYIRENDSTDSGNSTWSWSCSNNLVEGTYRDLAFGIVNQDPEPYVLGTGTVWINAHLSNLANTSKILSNVSLIVQLFGQGTQFGYLDYPSVWGQQFSKYSPNDVNNPTEYLLEGLDICVSRVDMQFRILIDDSALEIGDSFYVRFTTIYQNSITETLNFTIFVAADGTGNNDYSTDCPLGNFTTDMDVSLLNPKTIPLRYTDAWVDNLVHFDLKMTNNGPKCLTDIRYLAIVSENRSRASITQCNDYAGFASNTILFESTACFMTSPIGQGFFLRSGGSVDVQSIVFVDFDAFDISGGNISVVLKVYDEKYGINASKDIDFLIAVRPATYVGVGNFVTDISIDFGNVRDNPYNYNVYSQSKHIHFDFRILMENDEYAAIDNIKLVAECSASGSGTPYFSSYLDEAGFSDNPTIQNSDTDKPTSILFQSLKIFSWNHLHIHFYLNVHKDLFPDDDTVECSFIVWETGSYTERKFISFIINIQTTGAAVVTGDWTVSGMTLTEAQSHENVFAQAVASAANVSVSNVIVTCTACWICIQNHQRRHQRRRLEDITDVIISYEIILPEEYLTESITSNMQVLSTSEIDTIIASAAEAFNVSTASFDSLIIASVSNVSSYAITSAPTISSESSGGGSSSNNSFSVLILLLIIFGGIATGVIGYLYYKKLYCFEPIISKPEQFKPVAPRRIEVKRRKSTWSRISSRFSFSSRSSQQQKVYADTIITDLTGDEDNHTEEQHTDSTPQSTTKNPIHHQQEPEQQNKDDK